MTKLNLTIVILASVLGTGCVSSSTYEYSQNGDGTQVSATGQAAVEAAKSNRVLNQTSTIYPRPISVRSRVREDEGVGNAYLRGLNQRIRSEMRRVSPSRKIRQKIDQLEYEMFRCGLNPDDC